MFVLLSCQILTRAMRSQCESTTRGTSVRPCAWISLPCRYFYVLGTAPGEMASSAPWLTCRIEVSLFVALPTALPPSKFRTRQIFAWLRNCLRTNVHTQLVKRLKRWKGYAMYCVYSIKFVMLQVRENKISLRKWSGGATAQLRTFEGTLFANKWMSSY